MCGKLAQQHNTHFQSENAYCDGEYAHIVGLEDQYVGN